LTAFTEGVVTKFELQIEGPGNLVLYQVRDFLTETVLDEDRIVVSQYTVKYKLCYYRRTELVLHNVAVVVVKC